MKYHTEATRKYGYMSDYERLLLKRSLNTSFYVLECLESISFENLELALYMKITDPEMKQFVKLYEYQMEEAKLNKENFIKGLHGFYKKTAKVIVENPRNFFEFMDFTIRKSREKREVGYRSVFDAYLSLLMQQCVYIGYLKGYEEKVCCGVTTENELLFKDDLYPYSDAASYVYEDLIYKALKTKTGIDEKYLREAYRKYGYTVTCLEDVDLMDRTTRVYDNNITALLNYINEYTLQIVPNCAYKHVLPKLPRKWRETDEYIEALRKRKYVLPSDGITALYFNAGNLDKIIYQEIYKDDRIILLYKVFSKVNGEYSGYYDTKTTDFYSVYEATNLEEYHEPLKNFILENYYYLTCENVFDGRKLTVLKQVDDINHIDSYYGRQPVVSFQYHKFSTKSGKTGSSLRHYNRENYKSEKVSINGFIRRLPEGQSASMEAKQLAEQLGYELGENETFVRPFQKYVIKIKEV